MPAIGAIGSYGSISGYYSIYQNKSGLSGNPTSTQPVGPVSRAQTTPVPPVDRTPAVRRGAAQFVPEEKGTLPFPLMREGADPAEMAVRGRIVPMKEEDNQFLQDAAVKGQEGEETKSAQEVMEEAECQTCKNRKYQDGSDDPGVSFKTATNVAPEQAAAAVRGHEQEHVVRERAKAQREDRKVVSQSVTIHTAICPECGDVYVSGGTTRTSTKANPTQEVQQPEEEKTSGFQAVA